MQTHDTLSVLLIINSKLFVFLFFISLFRDLAGYSRTQIHLQKGRYGSQLLAFLYPISERRNVYPHSFPSRMPRSLKQWPQDLYQPRYQGLFVDETLGTRLNLYGNVIFECKLRVILRILYVPNVCKLRKNEKFLGNF